MIQQSILPFKLEITKDEINDTCYTCGRNYSFQDNELSIDLENGKAEGDDHVEKPNDEKKTQTTED